jgi:hypothetical protein
MSKEDEVLRSYHETRLEKVLISTLCIMGSFFPLFFLSFFLSPFPSLFLTFKGND